MNNTAAGGQLLLPQLLHRLDYLTDRHVCTVIQHDVYHAFHNNSERTLDGRINGPALSE